MEGNLKYNIDSLQLNTDKNFFDIIIIIDNY